MMNRVRCILPLLLMIVLLPAVAPGERVVSTPRRLPLQTVSRIVNRIGQIEFFIPKRGEGMADPRAKAIVALGDQATPFLIDKIADDTPIAWCNGIRWTVGDAALEMLGAIHPETTWPDPRGLIPMGDCFEWRDFRDVRANRLRVQKAWWDWYASRRD